MEIQDDAIKRRHYGSDLSAPYSPFVRQTHRHLPTSAFRLSSFSRSELAKVCRAFGGLPCAAILVRWQSEAAVDLVAFMRSLIDRSFARELKPAMDTAFV